jgi:hypothetical protein
MSFPPPILFFLLFLLLLLPSPGFVAPQCTTQCQNLAWLSGIVDTRLMTGTPQSVVEQVRSQISAALWNGTPSDMRSAGYTLLNANLVQTGFVDSTSRLFYRDYAFLPGVFETDAQPYRYFNLSQLASDASYAADMLLEIYRERVDPYAEHIVSYDALYAYDARTIDPTTTAA